MAKKKKKIKYRILSMAMTVVMILTLMPAVAMAENTVPTEKEPAVCEKLEGCTESTHAEGCPLHAEPELPSVPENVQAFLDAVNALEETEASINLCGSAYNALTTEEQAREDVTVAYAIFLKAVEAFNEPMIIPEVETAIYVSDDGDDTNNDGTTQDNAVATLAKAVEIAKDGATIYVMSDLTVDTCARITNKKLTITSANTGKVTISRKENTFQPIGDNNQSWYNPAMIEVTTTGTPSSVRLENIVLTDGGRHMGEYFLQTNQGTLNTNCVQDGMITAHGLESQQVYVYLGGGAELLDFGGMSAAYATGFANIVMESGSKICDDTVKDRIRGETGSTGPAGAIWVQGGSFTMQNGAEISDVIGRAVYVDNSGTATINGTISGIKSDTDMWQGEDGTVLHLRNSATADFSGVAEQCSGGVLVYTDKATFDMKQGSLLGYSDSAGVKTNEDPDWSKVNKADYNTDRNIITINGEITGIKNGKNPIQFKYGTLTIGDSGFIHDNSVFYGALYIQRDAVIHIYGKINSNNSSKRGGGIGTAGHGFVEINIYPGAEIKGNTAADTGGGASLKNCKFTMYGGEISGNTGQVGGGIYLYSDASADILGGTITNNTAIIDSNDLANDLAITSNNFGTNSIYLYISDEALVGNPAVYMETNTKTVLPGDRNIKLHNANIDSISALTAASSGKGWPAPTATFWVQRDGAADLTVGGLKLNDKLPVYVLTQKAGTNGKPASSDTPVNIYAAALDADGSVKCTLPAADVNENGCAAAIVQPTADFGTLAITGPNKITENKTEESYEIPYTATYKMSQNLASIIESGQAGINNENCKFKFEIQLDSRLTAKTGTGDYTFTSPIFDVDTVTENGSTLTVTCKLKDDWNNHISDLTTPLMTLTGTAVLSRDHFAAGKTLMTTGNVQVTASGSEIFIPANPCLTQMAKLAEYTITASAGSNGSISPDGSISVAEGSSQTFSITPDSGYLISDVMVDGQSVGAVSTYTFDAVKKDHTIAATFTLRSSGGGGNGGGGSGGGGGGTTITDPEVPLAGLDLNKDDHFAYIKGYEDGTVRPNSVITRAQVATIFYRLLSDQAKLIFFSDTNDFSDVTDDYWANKAISTLSNAEIINGFGDGTFRPNEMITRAQFAAIAARFSVVTEDLPNPFSDVPEGHWAEKLIAFAAHVGWVNGYSDGTFRPDASMTRAEAMKLINNVLERQVDEEGLLEDAAQWSDCSADDWFYYVVMEATNSHDWERRSSDSLMENWTALKDDPVWEE